MTVEINSTAVELPDTAISLNDFLNRQGIDGRGKAVAVDGSVVARSQWDTFTLADGMKIIVITAVCGG